MASGKTSKAVRNARSSIVVNKPKPWGMIAAVVTVLVFAGAVFGYSYRQWDIQQDKEAALAAYTPSEENKDPSDKIQGVEKIDYSNSRGHVDATQRVAYDKFPPFGGPHDATWAACNGVVYADPVRNENMVHPLEHGAVWIAYNTDQVTGPALDTLKAKVEGEQHIMLSPYPDLDKPISLQSWGHQLKLDSADDERIDHFITSLRENKYQHPEPGGRCDSDGTGFDPTKPPPFVAEKPGKDAVTMDGKGAIEAGDESGQAPATAPVTAPPNGTAPPAGSASAPAPSK